MSLSSPGGRGSTAIDFNRLFSSDEVRSAQLRAPLLYDTSLLFGPGRGPGTGSRSGNAVNTPELLTGSGINHSIGQSNSELSDQDRQASDAISLMRRQLEQRQAQLSSFTERQANGDEAILVQLRRAEREARERYEELRERWFGSRFVTWLTGELRASEATWREQQRFLQEHEQAHRQLQQSVTTMENEIRTAETADRERRELYGQAVASFNSGNQAQSTHFLTQANQAAARLQTSLRQAFGAAQTEINIDYDERDRRIADLNSCWERVSQNQQRWETVKYVAQKVLIVSAAVAVTMLTGPVGFFGAVALGTLAGTALSCAFNANKMHLGKWVRGEALSEQEQQERSAAFTEVRSDALTCLFSCVGAHAARAFQATRIAPLAQNATPVERLASHLNTLRVARQAAVIGQLPNEAHNIYNEVSASTARGEMNAARGFQLALASLGNIALAYGTGHIGAHYSMVRNNLSTALGNSLVGRFGAALIAGRTYVTEAGVNVMQGVGSVLVRSGVLVEEVTVDHIIQASVAGTMGTMCGEFTARAQNRVNQHYGRLAEQAAARVASQTEAHFNNSDVGGQPPPAPGVQTGRHRTGQDGPDILHLGDSPDLAPDHLRVAELDQYVRCVESQDVAAGRPLAEANNRLAAETNQILADADLGTGRGGRYQSDFVDSAVATQRRILLESTAVGQQRPGDSASVGDAATQLRDLAEDYVSLTTVRDRNYRLGLGPDQVGVSSRIYRLADRIASPFRNGINRVASAVGTVWNGIKNIGVGNFRPLRPFLGAVEQLQLLVWVHGPLNQALLPHMQWSGGRFGSPLMIADGVVDLFNIGRSGMSWVQRKTGFAWARGRSAGEATMRGAQGRHLLTEMERMNTEIAEINQLAGRTVLESPFSPELVQRLSNSVRTWQRTFNECHLPLNARLLNVFHNPYVRLGLGVAGIAAAPLLGGLSLPLLGLPLSVPLSSLSLGFGCSVLALPQISWASSRLGHWVTGTPRPPAVHYPSSTQRFLEANIPGARSLFALRDGAARVANGIADAAGWGTSLLPRSINAFGDFPTVVWSNLRNVPIIGWPFTLWTGAGNCLKGFGALTARPAHMRFWGADNGGPLLQVEHNLRRAINQGRGLNQTRMVQALEDTLARTLIDTDTKLTTFERYLGVLFSDAVAEPARNLILQRLELVSPPPVTPAAGASPAAGGSWQARRRIAAARAASRAPGSPPPAAADQKAELLHLAISQHRDRPGSVSISPRRQTLYNVFTAVARTQCQQPFNDLVSGGRPVNLGEIDNLLLRLETAVGRNKAEGFLYREIDPSRPGSGGVVQRLRAEADSISGTDAVRAAQLRDAAVVIQRYALRDQVLDALVLGRDVPDSLLRAAIDGTPIVATTGPGVSGNPLATLAFNRRRAAAGSPVRGRTGATATDPDQAPARHVDADQARRIEQSIEALLAAFPDQRLEIIGRLRSSLVRAQQELVQTQVNRIIDDPNSGVQPRWHDLISTLSGRGWFDIWTTRALAGTARAGRSDRNLDQQVDSLLRPQADGSPSPIPQLPTGGRFSWVRQLHADGWSRIPFVGWLRRNGIFFRPTVSEAVEVANRTGITTQRDADTLAANLINNPHSTPIPGVPWWRRLRMQYLARVAEAPTSTRRGDWLDLIVGIVEGPNINQMRRHQAGSDLRSHAAAPRDLVCELLAPMVRRQQGAEQQLRETVTTGYRFRGGAGDDFDLYHNLTDRIVRMTQLEADARVSQPTIGARRTTLQWLRDQVVQRTPILNRWLSAYSTVWRPSAADVAQPSRPTIWDVVETTAAPYRTNAPTRRLPSFADLAEIVRPPLSFRTWREGLDGLWGYIRSLGTREGLVTTARGLTFAGQELSPVLWHWLAHSWVAANDFVRNGAFLTPATDPTRERERDRNDFQINYDNWPLGLPRVPMANLY